MKYDLSDYSPWKQDMDWCSRQVFSRRPDKNDNEEGDSDKNPDGEGSDLYCRILVVPHSCLNKKNEPKLRCMEHMHGVKC